MMCKCGHYGAQHNKGGCCATDCECKETEARCEVCGYVGGGTCNACDTDTTIEMREVSRVRLEVEQLRARDKREALIREDELTREIARLTEQRNAHGDRVIKLEKQAAGLQEHVEKWARDYSGLATAYGEAVASDRNDHENRRLTARLKEERSLRMVVDRRLATVRRRIKALYELNQHRNACKRRPVTVISPATLEALRMSMVKAYAADVAKVDWKKIAGGNDASEIPVCSCAGALAIKAGDPVAFCAVCDGVKSVSVCACGGTSWHANKLGETVCSACFRIRQ